LPFPLLTLVWLWDRTKNSYAILFFWSVRKRDEVDKELPPIVRKKRPDLKIEGPIQYDAAVDMEVGKVKCQIQRQDKQVCLFS
jgi:hypothetical protein